MTLQVDIRLIGDRKLARALERLSGGQQRAIVRSALRDAAGPVLDAARAKAPVLTGALKNSLHIDRGRSRRALIVRVETGTRQDLGISASDPYFYPAAVEYGHPGAAARSYLRAALDERDAAARAVLRASIARGLVRVGRR